MGDVSVNCYNLHAFRLPYIIMQPSYIMHNLVLLKYVEQLWSQS